MFRAGVNVDIVRPGDDIRGYKLVLAPHLHVLPDSVATQLVDYVRGGGVLLAIAAPPSKIDESAYDRTLPGLLTPALGIEIPEYESLTLGITDTDAITYRIRTDPQLGETYSAIHYADWIKPSERKVMATLRPAPTQRICSGHAE